MKHKKRTNSQKIYRRLSIGLTEKSIMSFMNYQANSERALQTLSGR